MDHRVPGPLHVVITRRLDTRLCIFAEQLHQRIELLPGERFQFSVEKR